MTDPKLDRRKVWWAVLASVVAHFLIGLSLAAFGGSRQDIAVEEPQVPQLTIMQAPEPTPPPVVPKNAPMTTVDPARKSAVAPKEKTFEANETRSRRRKRPRRQTTNCPARMERIAPS